MCRWRASIFLSVLVLLCVFSLGTAVTRSSMIQEFEGIYYPLTSLSTSCTDVALNAAITAMQALSPPRTLLQLTPVDGAGVACTWTLATDVTVPRGITLRVPDGVRVSVNVGQTLTINGPLMADDPDWYTGAGTVTLTYRDWSVDGFGSSVVSGCLPAVPGSSLTLGAFACSAQILSNGQWYPVAQTDAAVGPLSAVNGTYWLALHRDTTTAVSGWTRQVGTHYLWRLVTAQPADPAGGLVLAKITVAGLVITAVGPAAPRDPLEASLRTVHVATRATGGDGAEARPWTGWETQIDWTRANQLILFAPGYYTQATGVVVSGHRIEVRGAGKHRTILDYTSTGAAWTFQLASAAQIFQNAWGYLALRSADVTTTKIGLKLVDVSEFHAEEFCIGCNANWTGNTSVGVQIQGRDVSSIRRAEIKGDIPLQISENPNNSISIDHFHFEDLYLLNQSFTTNSCVKIDTGVNLTSVTFDGYQAWIGGKDGLEWRDTTSVATSIGLTIKNVRWEQGTDVNGWLIRIYHNYSLQQLTLQNITGASSGNGVTLVNTFNTTIDHFQYLGSLLWLGLTASSYPVTVRQSYVGAGTVDLNGAVVQVFNAGQVNSAHVVERRYDTTTVTFPEYATHLRVAKALNSGRSVATYGVLVAIDPVAANYITIPATNGVAFAIDGPLNVVGAAQNDGKHLTIRIVNTSGGALGVITWAANYHLAGAFTSPATGNNRSITFVRDDSLSTNHWYEISRSPADIPN